MVIGAVILGCGYWYYNNHVMPAPVDLTTNRVSSGPAPAPSSESSMGASSDDEQPETPSAMNSAPAPVEEPSVGAVEEPVEEPVVEEPAIEEPAAEEPAVEEPAVEEPAVEEPAVEEPVAAAPSGGDYEALYEEAQGLRGRRKIDKLREAIAANPNGVGALADLAYILLNRSNFREAAELAERAVNIDPTSSKGWITLGAARQSLRDRSGAQEAYQACVDQGQGRYVRDCRAML